jgi:hypothetical protein
MALLSPPEALRHRVEAVVGATRGWQPVQGGFTAADRYVIELATGDRAFVKAATDSLTSGWLRVEHRMLTADPAEYMPQVVGWDGTDPPLLVLEDLSRAAWPPPWSPGRVERVLATLERVHAHDCPPWLPRLADQREALTGWSRVAEEPGPFLSIGVADRAWLAGALPALTAAASAAVLEGECLLHCDVRSDNIALLGGRTVLVDWDRCMVGNPAFDLAFWAPSLHHEEGPPPERVVGTQPELAATVAGFFAARAGLPPPHPGSTVRALQCDQLVTALAWACRGLDLPMPAALGTRLRSGA